MTLNWKEYVDIFKKLICSGWLVFKRSGKSLYMWVYPHCSLPTKYTIKEAYAINCVANDSRAFFGSTRATNYMCSLFYSTDECINERV